MDPDLVKGIGFDATCSLVAADIDTGKPITVTPNSWQGEPQAANDKGEFRDIILWADRALHPLSMFTHAVRHRSPAHDQPYDCRPRRQGSQVDQQHPEVRSMWRDLFLLDPILRS